MKTIIAAIAILSLTGCASIVNGTKQDVSIVSEPAGATYTVKETGQTGTTPANVELKRGNGYFSGADYTVTYRKEGYADVTRTVESKVSGWYWVGACVTIIGAAIVDPLTGGMWKIPEEVKATMQPSVASK